MTAINGGTTLYKRVGFQKQYRAAFLASSIGLICGMSVSWISCSLPIFLAPQLSPFYITSEELSTLAIMGSLGSIPGILIGWFFSDKYGRKRTLQLVCLPFAMVSIIYAVSTSKLLFFTAQFVGGAALSVTLVALPAYLTEISSREIRGNLTSFLTFSLAIGMLLEYVVVPLVSLQTNAFFMLVICFVSFVGLLFVPESPLFLSLKGRKDEQEDALWWLNLSSSEIVLLQNNDDSFEGVSKIVDATNLPNVRRALKIVFLLMFCYYFSGTSAIATYTLVLFEFLGSTLIPANIAGIILAIVSMLAILFCIFFMDSFGRKYLLAVTSITSMSSIFLLMVFYFVNQLYVIENEFLKLIPLFCLIIYRFSLSVGIETLTYVIVNEIFPTTLRSFSLCVVTILGSALSALSIKLFQVISENINVYTSLSIFLISYSLGIWRLNEILPETKGRCLDEIQTMLREVKRGARIRV